MATLDFLPFKYSPTNGAHFGLYGNSGARHIPTSPYYNFSHIQSRLGLTDGAAQYFAYCPLQRAQRSGVLAIVAEEQMPSLLVMSPQWNGPVPRALLVAT